MARFLVTLILAVASLQAANATPLLVTRDTPEVVPGPGLPSLESLGLTSDKLYAMPKPALPATNLRFQSNFNAKCGPTNSAYGPVAGVIACYHYLNALGKTNCKVPGNYGVVEFCRSGGSHTIGQSVTGNPESSYCSDVSLGLLWVIDHCTRPQQDVAGFQAPNGNGNMVVGGTNINY